MSLLSDYAKKALRHPLPTLSSADAGLHNIIAKKLQSAIEAFETELPIPVSPICTPAPAGQGALRTSPPMDEEEEDNESSETVMSKHSHALLSHIGSTHSVIALPVCMVCAVFDFASIIVFSFYF